MPTLENSELASLLESSPLFGAEVARDRAEQERKQRLAEDLVRRKQLLAAGDVVHRQSKVVSERRRHLERLQVQLKAVREEGQRPAGLTRWGSDILTASDPIYQEKLSRAEGAVRRCQADVDVEQAKLDELQRLVHRLERGQTA